MSRTATYTTSLMLICALLLAGTPLLMTAVAQNEESADLTRNFIPAPTWACGDSVTILIDIDWEPEPQGSNTGLSVEESYPSGWSVTGTTKGGSTGTPGQVKWFIQDPEIDELTYDLSIPDDVEGDFAFHGEYRDPSLQEGDPNKVIQENTTATVSCDSPGNGDGGGDENGDEGGDGAGSQIDRIFDADGDWSQGDGDRNVTLDLTWGDLDGRDPPQFFIEESVPAGMEATFPTNAGQVSPDGQTVKWWIDDDEIEEVSYTITIDGDHDLGTFNFQGEWRNDTMGQEEPNIQITGDQTATVGEEQEPPMVAADVQRALPLQAECTEIIAVTLDITQNDATELTVTETVPSGWTIQEPATGIEDPPGTLTWGFESGDPIPDEIVYEVLVPANEEGQFTFTGSFQDDTGADDGIGGDQQQDVTCPDEGSVTRSLPPVCGGTFQVAISVVPTAGTDAWFVEEIPQHNLSVGDISEGGTYNESQNKIKWVGTNGDSTELWYNLTVPDGHEAPTTYDNWSGEFQFDPPMDTRQDVAGDDQITSDCAQVHPYDQGSDCVFDDDDLFALIDAWKNEEEDATDEVLFEGIALWKLHPDPYCEDQD